MKANPSFQHILHKNILIQLNLLKGETEEEGEGERHLKIRKIVIKLRFV